MRRLRFITEVVNFSKMSRSVTSDLCPAHRKTLNGDWRVCPAHITGASFPHCSVGHTNCKCTHIYSMCTAVTQPPTHNLHVNLYKWEERRHCNKHLKPGVGGVRGSGWIKAAGDSPWLLLWSWLPHTQKVRTYDYILNQFHVAIYASISGSGVALIHVLSNHCPDILSDGICDCIATISAFSFLLNEHEQYITCLLYLSVDDLYGFIRHLQLIYWPVCTR